MGKLTAKHQAIIDQIVADPRRNKTKAYKTVYGCSDKAAEQSMSKLSKKPKFSQVLNDSLKKISEKFEISILEYQRRLAEKAYLDPLELYDETPDGDLKCKPLSEMSPAARQMVLKPKTVTIEAPNGNTISSTTFQTKDALKAEELLGKSIGAFQNDVDPAGDRPIFVGINLIINNGGSK